MYEITEKKYCFIKNDKQEVGIITGQVLLYCQRLLLLLIVCLIPVQVKADIFAKVVDYKVGDTPLSVTCGDFNNDGNLDMAVTSGDSGSSVRILLGRGDGTFTQGKSYTTDALYSIINGDFNEDGHLDIAAVDRDSRVSVFLGAGDGTFAKPEKHLLGEGSTALISSDFNDDGHLDMAIANASSNNVSVLLGSGDGEFAKAMNYPAGVRPISIVSGDFDFDGLMDIVVSNYVSESLSVLLGVGSGRFSKAENYPVGEAPSYIVSGDFNNDSNLDIATGNLLELRVVFGGGDGTFGGIVQYEVRADYFCVTSGDFNGDSKLDIITADGSGNIHVLLGSSHDKLALLSETHKITDSGFDVVTFPSGIANGDFNNDGRLDVVVVNSGIGTVGVLLNKLKK